MRNRTKGATQYTRSMMELDILMYMEELPYIPEMNLKYMEGPLIYLKYVRNQPQTKYVGEPRDPRNVALTSNDNSYA